MIVLKVLSTTRKMEYVDQKEEINEGRSQSAMMVTDTKNHSLKILAFTVKEIMKSNIRQQVRWRNRLASSAIYIHPLYLWVCIQIQGPHQENT